MHPLPRFNALAAAVATMLVVVAAIPALAAPAKSPAARSAKPRVAAAAKWQPVVPFIEDDFGRALALAKERKLPVFIEGWAPW